jgi:hypothetical protein
MTKVPFNPRPDAAFQFSATLDGEPHTMLVPWNVFGQRWYLVCLGANGLVVFNVPVVGSPDEGNIDLVAGYFSVSQMFFRIYSQTFEIVP